MARNTRLDKAKKVVQKEIKKKNKRLEKNTREKEKKEAPKELTQSQKMAQFYANRLVKVESRE